MSGLLILILIAIILPYAVRWARPYIYRWMQRRAENYMRQAMGMPPRDKTSEKSRKKNSSSRASYSSQSRDSRRSNGHEPLIPKEYAEDVTFTEIHSYSEDTVIGADDEGSYVKTESQVTDAEIIEIKKS